jgi:hypothetical protein
MVTQWYVGKVKHNDLLTDMFPIGLKVYYKPLRIEPKIKRKLIRKYGDDFVKQQEREIIVYTGDNIAFGVMWLTQKQFKNQVAFIRNGKKVKAKNSDNIDRMYGDFKE